MRNTCDFVAGKSALEVGITRGSEKIGSLGFVGVGKLALGLGT